MLIGFFSLIFHTGVVHVLLGLLGHLRSEGHPNVDFR